MATIEELRERTAALFTRMPEAGAAGRDAARPFRWFDPDDAEAAVGLAAQLAIVAGSAPDADEGLERALDLAERRATELGPALVRQALSVFVTHHTPARRLGKPRTVRTHPEMFAPSARDSAVPEAERGASPGPEPALDYWREDPFANEHHDHWHQVYPFPGLPLFADWLVWAETADRGGLALLLGALDPATDWPAFLAAATPAEIRDEFFRLVQSRVDDFDAFVRGLPAAAYRVLFRLNDRQGELFFYMHSQMLARYDAERLSNGRDRVVAFGPQEWAAPVAEGYTPNLEALPGLPPFTARPVGAKLPQRDIDLLTRWHASLETAITSGRLVAAAGSPRTLDRDSIGHATEAARSQLSGLSRTEYPGTHNQGHGILGSLPDDQGFGVMNVPAVAIRDPVFWRWHKYVDDIATAWQDTQTPYDFADAPPVVLRDALTGAAQPWTSPDLLLVDTQGLAAGTDAAALATATFGGAAFDTAFGPGTHGSLTVVDELTTRMATSALSDGTSVTYLVHDPFALVVRLRNTVDQPVAVTVRVFAAPADLAADRTAWMELDKVLVELPASGRVVLYRPDTEFAVVKKPAETDPQTVLDGEADPNDPDYCDCGWPYTLLLPRGTPAGMPFRLAVFCTDAARDLVRPSAGCGSMSFCGAVDRYPDTRDMGYPFSRPFARPIEQTVLDLPSTTGRTLTVRHIAN